MAASVPRSSRHWVHEPGRCRRPDAGQVVDEQHQPRYLTRAAELKKAILRLAVIAGMTAEDMPGLHGLCVAAARTSEGRQER